MGTSRLYSLEEHGGSGVDPSHSIAATEEAGCSGPIGTGPLSYLDTAVLHTSYHGSEVSKYKHSLKSALGETAMVTVTIELGVGLDS